MLLREHDDFLTTLCIFPSETSMKMYWKTSEKFRKCKEKFKCSCNLCVTKVDNNLEITSVRSSLDLGNKIWIGKPFMDIVFHFKNSRLRFFIFATRKLWNYLVQVFLVGFSSFLLSDYSSLLKLRFSKVLFRTRLISAEAATGSAL